MLTIYKHNITNTYQQDKTLIRDYRNFDINQFLLELHESTTNLLLENENLNANSLCDKFIQTYENLITRHAPNKSISRKKQKLRQKPWINRTLLKMIRNKNRMFKKYIRKQTQSTFEDYKALRNQVNRGIEKSKKEYYQHLFSSTTDSKKLWRNINSLLKYKTPRGKKECIKEIYNSNGNITTESSEIANILNNFFASIGTDLAGKIPRSDENSTCNLLKSVQNSMYFSAITANEITRIIDTMDAKKATPSNTAPIWFLKISAPFISNILSEMFNRCIDEGTFPDIFKTAEIIPLFKSGDKKSPNNHRPIALLDPFSKIFER